MFKDKKLKKYILIFLIVVSVLSLIPVMYCGLFDYATGDDFGKSANVHILVVQGASLFEILAQAGRDMVDVWKGFEGTWASNFVLAMQPGIWGERVYSITPFLGLIFMLVGSGLFLYEIIVKRMGGYSKEEFFIIFLPLVIIMPQFMPFIRGGLYWFTGMAHYTIPYGTALLLLVLNSRYLATGRKILIPFMILLSIYIGGSHYQAILLVLILQFFFVFIWYPKENKRYLFTMAAQVVLELVGLAICAKAPGNSVRAGGEFGFGIDKAVYTVFHSITTSAVDGFKYLSTVQLIPAYIFFVIAFAAVCGKRIEKNMIPKYLFVIVFSFLTYCAVYAPGVYYNTYEAELSISGGFYDFNFFCFLIFLTVASVMIGEILGALLTEKTVRKCALCFVGFAFIISVAFCKDIVKGSADYMMVNFIRSGQLADFAAQMEERIKILSDDTVKDAVVPEMNDQQGPFMHMALTSDPNNFTNSSTMRYYGKDSVIAIPRNRYYEEYGE